MLIRGPRQCGTTTLAREFVPPASPNYFDLENPAGCCPRAFFSSAAPRNVEHHPKLGASWEGYAVEEILKAFQLDDAYYWATHNGAEIDLVLFKNGKRIGIECKRADAPALTPPMRIALADLKLDQLLVAYPASAATASKNASKSCRWRSW